MHLIVFNKNPGGEFISKKNYNQYKDMFTKTIFKDELKQIYDERQSLRDKIIDKVKKTVDGFEINIGEPSADFAEKLNELRFSLDGYKGKKNYQFLSKDQKEKVDAVVKVVCQDDNLQKLYRQWCLVELTRLGKQKAILTELSMCAMVIIGTARSIVHHTESGKKRLTK